MPSRIVPFRRESFRKIEPEEKSAFSIHIQGRQKSELQIDRVVDGLLDLFMLLATGLSTKGADVRRTGDVGEVGVGRETEERTESR